MRKPDGHPPSAKHYAGAGGADYHVPAQTKQVHKVNYLQAAAMAGSASGKR